MFDVTHNRRLTSENRQTGRRTSKDRTPGKHRQDGGYENNQPTTATTSNVDHHQREGFERGDFIHLSREHCLNYRRSGRGCQIERESGRRARNTFINLESIWKSLSLSHHQQQNSVGFSIQTSSQSVLLYGSETWQASHKEYFQKVADLY
uniref:Uncharacterized protein n=1 Tax=Trichobilharzia regenti TaxID=157069 RepID=A0AA85JW32_TRIRE|nr:unnamed protein product [Trichobilharzia regenti]